MCSISRAALLASIGLSVSGCAYLPTENLARTVEVIEFVKVVDCEVVGAVRNLKPSVFKLGTWDVKSSLELTLVSQLDADGKVGWTIPVGNTLTPNVTFGHKNASIAHVDFITRIRDAMKDPTTNCDAVTDPSGTGLGLAAWMVATFDAVGKDRHGGLTYTSEFELTAAAGGRFGFGFTNVGVDVGASATRIGTHRLVVTVSPHVETEPTEVIIVGDKTKAKGQSRRVQILTNPIGNQNLLRQSPVKLQPGSRLLLR